VKQAGANRIRIDVDSHMSANHDSSLHAVDREGKKKTGRPGKRFLPINHTPPFKNGPNVNEAQSTRFGVNVLFTDKKLAQNGRISASMLKQFSKNR